MILAYPSPLFLNCDARFLEPILNFLTGFTYLFIVKLVIYCLPDFPFAVKTTVPFAAIYENVKRFPLQYPPSKYLRSNISLLLEVIF